MMLKLLSFKHKWKSRSQLLHEKGSCIAEYEAMVKKSEGAIHNHE